MARAVEGTRQSRSKKAWGTTTDKRNGSNTRNFLNASVVGYFKPTEEVETDIAKNAWEAYWEDQQSCLLTPSSKHLLERWVAALDRYEKLIAQADEEPTVIGSTGQPIANALYKIAYQALSTAERLERQLGMGPLNAASLGLAAIQERQGMEEINKAIADLNDDDEDFEDPR